MTDEERREMVRTAGARMLARAHCWLNDPEVRAALASKEPRPPSEFDDQWMQRTEK